MSGVAELRSAWSSAAWSQAIADVAARSAGSAATTRSAAPSVAAPTSTVLAAGRFVLPEAPRLDRERTPMDVEGFLAIVKQASDASATAARGAAHSANERRETITADAAKKAEEARHEAESASWWSKIASFFSWAGKIIGAALSVAAAAITGGTLAIVAASCMAAKMLVDETGLAQRLGVLGAVMSGALDVGSAVTNVCQMAMAVVRGTLSTAKAAGEDAGVFGVWLNLTVSMPLLAASAEGVGNLTKSLSPSGVASTLSAVKQVGTGLARVGEGVGDVGAAVATYDGKMAELAGQRLRVDADRVGRSAKSLVEVVEDEMERSGRLRSAHDDVAAKQASIRTQIVSGSRA